jgi:Tol biopolymer transport system component
MVSLDWEGYQPAANFSPSAWGGGWNPSISADGSEVAFVGGIGLVSHEIDSGVYVYIKSVGSNDIEQVGQGLSWSETNPHRDNFAFVEPEISADGRYVAFQNGLDALVPGDTNFLSDILRYDRSTLGFDLVSTDVQGLQAKTGVQPTISADGRYVVFSSSAPDLIPGDTEGARDVFVKDLQSGEIVRVNETLDLPPATAFLNPAISADGHHVVFQSHSPGGSGDIYVANLSAGPNPLFSDDFGVL